MKIYFHSDLDGKASAAIVKKAIEDKRVPYLVDESPEYIEMDYSKVLDLSTIRKSEVLIIVDFSFKPEVMNEILKITGNIVWLDHHATCKDYKYINPDGEEVNLAGIRDFTNKGPSGCELTWKFFFSDKDMPACVKLIGDRDSWRWEIEGTAFFNEGMKLANTDPQSVDWEYMFDDDGFTVAEIMDAGEICVKYRDMVYAQYIKTFSYETKLHKHNGDGTASNYDCIVINMPVCGSEAFGDLLDKYDIGIEWTYNGEAYTISFYTKKPDIDVSEIAVQFKGGGHRGASGCVMKELPDFLERKSQ